jgi:hypothetical protein
MPEEILEIALEVGERVFLFIQSPRQVIVHRKALTRFLAIGMRSLAYQPPPTFLDGVLEWLMLLS